MPEELAPICGPITLYGGGNLSSYYFSNANARFTRSDTNFYGYRARINLTTDWRTQTDYGVLRAYAAIIAQQQSGDAGTTGFGGYSACLHPVRRLHGRSRRILFRFLRPGRLQLHIDDALTAAAPQPTASI